MDCRVCEKPLPPNVFLCRFCGRWTRERTSTEEQAAGPAPKLIPLSEVEDATIDRLGAETWWAPLLGGGGVRGTTILVGGDPGGGKSTISLQIADDIADETPGDILYLPTEEKPSFIRGRASRLLCRNLNRIVVPAEPLTAELELLDHIEPGPFMILDSLPDLVGHDDKSAVEVCKRLSVYAQATDTLIFILDHVTKGEEFAGLKRLEHAVDVTVYLRSKHRKNRRTWETIKNRFGDGFVSRDLVMTAQGLELAPIEDEEAEEEIPDAESARALRLES
jgi:DNA repair protein RadA/Sms